MSTPLHIIFHIQEMSCLPCKKIRQIPPRLFMLGRQPRECISPRARSVLRSLQDKSAGSARVRKRVQCVETCPEDIRVPSKQVADESVSDNAPQSRSQRLPVPR